MNTKELNAAPISSILAHYNELAKAAGLKELKGFKDKPTAIAKVAQIKAVIAEQKKEASKPAKKVAVKAAKKAAKKSSNRDPLGEEETKKGRGAVAVFDYEPAERQTAPRPGTLRGRAFELLQVGTTAEDLEDLVVTFWKEKGIKPEEQKIGKRLRALELVRLLRYQNGYGFKEKNGQIYVIGDLSGSKPAKAVKESKVPAKKAAKKATKKTAKTEDVL